MAGRSRGAELLHCGGMIGFAAAAHAMPIETLLGSYAVLGPLHYLTEWSWLHDRGYGLKRDRDDLAWRWPVLVLLSLVVFVMVARSPLSLEIATISAVAIALTGRRTWWVWGVAALFGAAVAAGVGSAYAAAPILVVVLLPNVLHIFVFTPLFAVSGVVRSPSRSGVAALVLWVACVASFVVLPTRLPVPQGADSSFSLFSGELEDLSRVFGGSELPNALLGLTAFAYGFHYLSWFSAADLVGWRRMPERRALAIGGAWVVALLAFAADYRLGFLLTFPLSFGHELFEFPTNVSSLRHVGRASWDLLRRRWSGRSAVVA